MPAGWSAGLEISPRLGITRNYEKATALVRDVSRANIIFIVGYSIDWEIARRIVFQDPTRRGGGKREDGEEIRRGIYGRI
jgi:hypothetical protein